MISHRDQMLRHLLVVTMVFIFGWLCASCQSAPAAKPAAEAKPTEAPSIILGPGDSIEIKFAYAGQFNETQTIRPDGKIQLQLVGVVVAQGKSPEELGEELTAKYADQLKHPQLVIIVRTLNERRVYVGGEVNKPGLVEMPGNLNVMEAIMHAGGFNLEKAEVKNVVVVRRENGKQCGYLVNLKDALAGAEVQPFQLEPRDIVYVPRTTIADADQWISQHLYKLLPPIYIGIPLL